MRLNRRANGLSERAPLDAIPCGTGAVPATRPDQLALYSWLHGGPLPPVEGYRVLEVGCADGGNLLPLAFYHPEITASGIDTSAVRIGAATSAASHLGLTNIEFSRIDLRDYADLDCGNFDYIIAHGVLSWVAPEVGRALLVLCRRHLAPHGLACVSYNTYPGWKIRELPRDMILPRIAEFGDIQDRTTRARELARSYRDLLASLGDHPYFRLLSAALRLMAESEPAYVAHDLLEEHNHPYFFHEFTRLLSSAGLAYITDARFDLDEVSGLAGTRATLGELGFADVELEGLVDLLGYRHLRASILALPHEPAPRPGANVLADRRVAVSSLLTFEGGKPDLTPGVDLELGGPCGRRYGFNNPFVKAALYLLDVAERPALPAEELIGASTELVAAHGFEPPGHDLAELVFFLAERGLLELRFNEPAIPTDVKHCAHSLARLEAGRGKVLTTPRHTQFVLDDFDQDLVRHVGDVLAKDAFIERVIEQVRQRLFAVQIEGVTIEEPTELRASLGELYDATITNLAAEGLLESP